MEGGSARRSSWVACPKCGHKVARVRICDMEVKCHQCSYRFEAVIGASTDVVQDRLEKYPAEPAASDKGQVDHKSQTRLTERQP